MAKLYDKFINFSILRTIVIFIVLGVIGLVILGIAALVTWLFAGNFEIYHLSFNIIAYIYLGILAILLLLLVIKFILTVFGLGVMAASKIKNFSIKHKEKKMLRKKEKERKKLEDMNEEELTQFLHDNAKYIIHIFPGDKATSNAIVDLLKVGENKYSWNRIDPIEEGYEGNDVDWWDTSDIQWLEEFDNDDTPHIDIGTEKGTVGYVVFCLSKQFPNVVLGFAWNDLTSRIGVAHLIKNGESHKQKDFDLDEYLSEDAGEKDNNEEYLKLLNDEGKAIYNLADEFVKEHPEELEILKQENDAQINE